MLYHIVIVITTLLSFVFGGGGAGNACDRDPHYTDQVVQCSDQDAPDNKTDYCNAAIIPVRTASYSGDGNNFVPSYRPTSSGRRIQPTTKFAFLIIKAGKVFDRNNSYTFQTDLKQFSSGIHSSFRYIYSICQLLI